MFSRGFGGRDTPRTFQACERLWADKPRAVKRYDRVKLGNETYLYRGRDCFVAKFHDNTIVRYLPEHKTIHACGFDNSPTTQGRIGVLAGVRMSSNSKLGYEQSVRVNGFPYFDGMRIDNYGNIFEEDKLPDFKEVPKKEVVRQYVALFSKIKKLTLARWEVGEWNDRSAISYGTTLHTFQQLLKLEEEVNAGETHLDSVRLFSLFGAFGRATTHDDMMKLLRDDLRVPYYTHYDGYETIEVK